MSGVLLIGDYDDREDARCLQLLALHGLRRSLECLAASDRAALETIVSSIHRPLIAELKELIAALDRRVPQVARAGELSIARDAAALRAKAVKRIAKLEAED